MHDAPTHRSWVALLKQYQTMRGPVSLAEKKVILGPSATRFMACGKLTGAATCAANADCKMGAAGKENCWVDRPNHACLPASVFTWWLAVRPCTASMIGQCMHRQRRCWQNATCLLPSLPSHTIALVVTSCGRVPCACLVAGKCVISEKGIAATFGLTPSSAFGKGALPVLKLCKSLVAQPSVCAAT